MAIPTTSASGKLFEAKSLWTGQIGSGGVPDATTTTIPLASATGLTNGNAYIFTIDRVDASGNKTPSKREVCIGELSGTNFINCVRGVEGTAQAHSSGAVVEILMTATHWNKLLEMLNAEHNDDGTHKIVTLDEQSSTPSSPSSGQRKTFVNTDGELQMVDSSGNVSGVKTTTIQLAEQSSTPTTPASGKGIIYIDSDDKLAKYLLDSGLIYALETNWGKYRQAIINGNFDIWQRGNSFTDGGYTADRWIFNVGGAGANTVTQQSFAVGQTDVPNNPKYYIEINITTAWTDSNLTQKIEDVRTFAGMTVSYSFWAKGTAGNTLTTQFAQYFGSSGSTQVVTTVSTHTLSTSWQKFTGTVTLPSITGKTISGGDDSLQFVLKTGSQTGTFDIAQVQLNAGEIVLPFYPRSVAEELRLCQRYYQKSYNYDVVPGTATIEGAVFAATKDGTNDGDCYVTIFLPIEMRTNPTLTYYSCAGNISKISNDRNTTSDASVAAGGLFATTKTVGGDFSIGTGNPSAKRLFHYELKAEL